MLLTTFIRGNVYAGINKETTKTIIYYLMPVLLAQKKACLYCY